MWQAVRDQLRPGDVLIHGLRLTDSQGGDVEVDLLLLLPDSGIVTIEVKGGTVTYADGQWLTSGKGSRRIHPTEQARRAKHAVRRFLDRQPQWGRGMVRAEWFLAFPHTEVLGDMGPEGRRSLILGRDDMTSALERILEVMQSPVAKDPVPQGDWVDEALHLLMGNSFVEQQQNSKRKRRLFIVAAASVAAVLLAAGGTFALTHRAPACAEGYSPCLPVAADMDCIQIGTQVTVTGSDPYRLDRDGNGLGCESFPAP